jgi:glycerol-3-phosphate dehydrogenase (NAD(P)+)
LGLARGQRLDTILAELGHVAEGVPGAHAVRDIAVHHGVDMPIVDVVCRVLDAEVPLRDAVLMLLARATGAEQRAHLSRFGSAGSRPACSSCSSR